MKEDDIVAQLINELEAATANNVDVRTMGTDQEVDPPELILDWNKTRLDGHNGHNSFGDYIKNDSGQTVGIEHHIYSQMEVDIIARSYDELERDQLLDTTELAFLHYEYDSDRFNRDTAEWDIGSRGPRENPVIEPDWFEAGIVVSFDYLKRKDDTSVPAEPIETIQDSVEVDESLEDSSTTVN